MSQDQSSGAAANQWGRQTARKIAGVIGAELVSKNSNECILNDERIVIKCARPATTSVGVTYQMLERLDWVIAAFQADNGAFDLRKISAKTFKEHMRPTASRGTANGKVGIVQRVVFEERGELIDSVRLPNNRDD